MRPGWRCLEIGAGGGSIAAWLAARGGAVVATDLDITVLGDLSGPGLEVHRHDVEADDPPGGPFDLIHVRLLLAWLRDSQAALRRIVAALKPGGWLVAEEMDFVSVVADPRVDAEASARFVRVVDAHNAALAANHSFDPFYGRRVAGDLADAGLGDVASEGRAGTWRGGEPGGTVWRLSLLQLREAMLATGRVSADDIDAAVALCADPGFGFLSQVTVAAWGRRPGAW